MNSRSAILFALAAAAVMSGPLAAQQFGELLGRGLPAGRDHSHSVALGDVDGDGDVDAVFGNADYAGTCSIGCTYDGEQNRLYLNDGDGRFTDATAGRLPLLNDLTRAVVLGDLDGDGDLDLIVGNDASGPDALYLNDGTGTFVDASATHLPATAGATRALALGDLDRDGDLDLIVGRNQVQFSADRQNRIYLNDGTGRFTDVTTQRMPTLNDYTSSAALGDVDGDGDLDIVFGNAGSSSTSGQNRLYLNDGKGAYVDSTVRGLPARADSTESVALCDVDSDGDLDLVFGNAGQNTLLENDGTGVFTDVTATRLPSDGDRTRTVAAADVDGDGDADLVVGNEAGARDRLYLNDGSGRFVDATTTLLPADASDTLAAATADVDGDGDVDLVFGTDTRQRSRLYLNDGSGSYADATAPRVPADQDGTHAIVLGDVDGDGDLDLALGNSGQQNRLHLNDGTGTWTDVTTARMPGDVDDTRALVLGDVDNDGDPDLVVGNVGQNRLYLNDGTGTFLDATQTRLPVYNDYTSAVLLTDVDGDGDLDLFACNAGQQSRLYLNDGAGTFTDVTAARLPASGGAALCAAMVDVDGDRDLDLVLGGGLWLNDGAGTYSDATAARMPAMAGTKRPFCVTVGDVDGDGDADIALGMYGGCVRRDDRLYLNDGNGLFTDATAQHLPNGPSECDTTTALAMGDVDADGDLDLVLGITYSGVPEWGGRQNRVYLNRQGTGTFVDATITRMPGVADTTRAVALGDVDGDGDLDIAFGNESARTRLYSNLMSQLDLPFLMKVGRSTVLEAYDRWDLPTRDDFVLPFLSIGTASIPLPPLGTLRLDPAAIAALPPFLVTHPGGVGSISIAVPNDARLAGVTIHFQAVQGPDLAGARLTNRISGRIQP